MQRTTAHAYPHRRLRRTTLALWGGLAAALSIGGALIAAGADPFEAPAAVVEHQAAPSEPWNLLLVNRWNPLPAQHSVNLTELSNGESVDSRIYPDLQAMLDAADDAGKGIVVGSAFRTFEFQQQLLADKIAELEAGGYSPEAAAQVAGDWVADPGTSEHEAGLAVDLNADPGRSSNDEVYRWLADNGYRYGFVLRYPPAKSETTGVAHEPWHYRFVGKEAAQQMHESGQCLEEYLQG